VRRAALAAAVALGAALLLVPWADVRYQAWRALAGVGPGEPDCEGWRAGSAALLEGDTVTAGCAAHLRSVRDLVERLAADRSVEPTTRLAALDLLVGEWGESAPGLRALLDLGLAPEARRALLSLRSEGPGSLDLALAGRAMAIHGGWAEGAWALDGAGEPEWGEPAARALRLLPDETPVDDPRVRTLGVGASALALAERWGASWGGTAGASRDALPGEAELLVGLPRGSPPIRVVEALVRWRAARAGELPAPPQPPLAFGDEGADLLFEPESADVIREWVHAVARWVAVADPARRPERLLAAFAHPSAVPAEGWAAWRRGGAVAVLRDGAGAPGTMAWLLAAAGAEAGVPVVAGPAGGGVWLQVGPAEVVRDPCGRPADAPRGAPWTPEAMMAAALLEGAGAALRAGDGPRAIAALDRVATLVPELPGGEAARELRDALSRERSPATAGERPVRGVTLLLRPPGRRKAARRVEVGGTDPGAAPWAPHTEDPELRLLIGWWTARAGDLVTARALLPVRPPEAPRQVELAAGLAALLDEPGGRRGALATWVRGGPAPFAGCPGADPLWPAAPP